MREPTMADIAAHLGVSRALVSIVLRDMPGASDETRQRVMQAAKELGYRPHIGARTLRQYRSREIGVAFAPAHAGEPDIVEAIYPATIERGYRVVLSAQTGHRSMETAVEELVGYRCAAIILIGPELDDAELQAIARRARVPAVVVNSGERNRAYDVVRSAGDTGIGLAVQHLVELGHRQIAYVHTASMPPAALRLQGYRRAVADADIISVPGDDYTEESGAAAGRELLDRRELPTAVVAGNDQQAIGLLQVFSRAGIAIPGDVSLTGYDDSRVARLSSVDLTTARQDPQQMGQAAVSAAVRRIDQPDRRPVLSIVEASLVVRSSTSTPRRSVT